MDSFKNFVGMALIDVEWIGFDGMDDAWISFWQQKQEPNFTETVILVETLVFYLELCNL